MAQLWLALPLVAQLASPGAPAHELLTDLGQLADAVRAPPRSSPSPRLRPTAATAALPRLASDERRGFARQCPGHVGTPRLGPARPLAPGMDDPDVEAVNSAYESHVQFYTMAKAFSLLIAVMMLLIAMFADFRDMGILLFIVFALLAVYFDNQKGMTAAQARESAKRAPKSGGAMDSVYDKMAEVEVNRCKLWKGLFFFWTAFWAITIIGAFLAILFPPSKSTRVGLLNMVDDFDRQRTAAAASATSLLSTSSTALFGPALTSLLSTALFGGGGGGGGGSSSSGGAAVVSGNVTSSSSGGGGGVTAAAPIEQQQAAPVPKAPLASFWPLSHPAQPPQPAAEQSQPQPQSPAVAQAGGQMLSILSSMAQAYNKQAAARRAAEAPSTANLVSVGDARL